MRAQQFFSQTVNMNRVETCMHNKLYGRYTEILTCFCASESFSCQNFVHVITIPPTQQANEELGSCGLSGNGYENSEKGTGKYSVF